MTSATTLTGAPDPIPADVPSLVPQYIDLVYATARRIVGDAHLAEDVTQAAFIVLMRKVDRVDRRTLAGWLVNTTRLAAKDALRSQGRRRTHEARAAALRPKAAADDGDPTTAQVLPLLDEALSHLSAVDRTAVALRYLQSHTFAQVAAATGSTEEASRKRVARAVERLRVLITARGVAPSVAGLTVILAAQQSPAAPPAVAAAAMSATPAGAALAKGTLATMKWSQLKLAALLTSAVVTAAGGVWLGTAALAQPSSSLPPSLRPSAGAPKPIVPPAPIATRPTDPGEPFFGELQKVYTLQAGQVLALFPAPFDPARTAWADAEFPYAHGADRVRSIGFTWDDGRLSHWNDMSYADADLADIIESPLGEAWYRADGLDAVPWQPVQGDFVVRSGSTSEQRFAALADLITQRTGIRVRFVPHTAGRPCVVLRGMTGVGPDRGGHFPTVVLAQTPLTRNQIIDWGRGEQPDGSTHAFQFAAACESLDAPFFLDPPDLFEHGDFRWNTLFPIGPDAILQRTDPGYQKKLRAVLDNVQAQIGGEFAIEQRPIETFTLERLP